jgi:hypothetical protein
MTPGDRVALPDSANIAPTTVPDPSEQTAPAARSITTRVSPPSSRVAQSGTSTLVPTDASP